MNLPEAHTDYIFSVIGEEFGLLVCAAIVLLYLAIVVRVLVRLLDEYISSAGLTVIIGSEHHAPDLRCFSVVAATYNDGRGTGTVGVIGPTRMRYSRAINAVDMMTRAISRVASRNDV